MSRKSIIITVLSGKGGTGKTIISANLASVIAEAGYSVLLVDFDYYVRSLTLLLTSFTENIKSENWGELFLASSPEIQTLKERKEKIEQSIMKIREATQDLSDSVVNVTESEEHGTISLLPSYVKITKSPVRWDSVAVPLDLLTARVKILLEEIRGRYEFVVIDNHAGPNKLGLVSSLFSDYSVIVTEIDRASLDASFYLKYLIEQLYEEERPDSDFIDFLALNKIEVTVNEDKLEGELEKELKRERLRRIISGFTEVAVNEDKLEDELEKELKRRKEELKRRKEELKRADLRGILRGRFISGGRNNLSFLCRYIPEISSELYSYMTITPKREECKEFRYALLHLWKKIASSEEGIELTLSQKEELKEDPFYNLY